MLYQAQPVALRKTLTAVRSLNGNYAAN
jgi:hypothetical protein